MTVRLDLPRETGSVLAVRRLLRCALSVLHVDRSSGDDLEIAITEACANVVNHASGETFEVSLDVADDRCAIDVRDRGAGFDTDAVETEAPGAGCS
jgi:serine/threonine-protein kinase RsbW